MTVGYGDISPQTVPGQTAASLIIVMGCGVVAVPTGIVTAEITRAQEPSVAEPPAPLFGVRRPGARCRRSLLQALWYGAVDFITGILVHLYSILFDGARTLPGGCVSPEASSDITTG